MKKQKAKQPKAAPENPNAKKARERRAAFTVKELTALVAEFPKPEAIVGVVGKTDYKVEQLVSRLKENESSLKFRTEEYVALREKGLDEINDWELSMAKNATEALKQRLKSYAAAVQLHADNIATYKARLAELQGALAPALPQPAVSVETAKKKTVESAKDVTWIHVPIKVLEACLLCASKKDVRHYLEGVYLHQFKKDLRVVATNGHALMLHSGAMENPNDHTWLEAGIILPRDELAIALSVFGKLKNFDDEPISAVQLGYGKDHGSCTLRDPDHFASFKIPVVDGKYPDYQKVIESAGNVLAGGDRQALSGTSMNAEYLKIATVISAKLECKGITPFSSDEKSPTVVSFLGAPGALFIVMPIQADSSDQLPVQTMALIGRGLEGTLAALKATNTRQRKQAADTKNEDERKSLEAQIAARDERIANVSQAIKGRLLQAPSAA